MNLIHSDHLSEEICLRLLDDEIDTSDRITAESHLALCDICKAELAAIERMSSRIDGVVRATGLPVMSDVRQNLAKHLQSRTAQPLTPQPGRVMRRFGWGMGIAATLAFGVLIAPHYDSTNFFDMHETLKPPTHAQATAIEIDGETFLPVPYTNSDLDTSVPHIVQMQVPMSSLADIGIVVEPVTNRVGAGSEIERSVLADVLVGADGQPRGVHVLGTE